MSTLLNYIAISNRVPRFVVMNKGFIGAVLFVVGACVIFWSAMSGSKPVDQQPVAKATEEDQAVRKGDSDLHEKTADPVESGGRESPRHAAGDLEKHRQGKTLTELNKAVMDQEARVEERRKILSTIVRTKGIVYKSTAGVGSNGEPSVDVASDNTTEDVARRSQDTQDYVDAKRDFEVDQQLLLQLKLKQIKAKIEEDMGVK